MREPLILILAATPASKVVRSLELSFLRISLY
jgi:hypothetical protein